MPLFAADPFWKVPNVHELVGAVGLLLAVASIWLSWWLAKRDLRKQAARFAARLALGWLEAELADGLRCLREARRAVRDRDGVAAVLRLDDAEYYVGRAVNNPWLTAEERETLRPMPKAISELIDVIRKLGDQRTLSGPRLQKLGDWIGELTDISGRLRAAIVEP